MRGRGLGVGARALVTALLAAAALPAAAQAASIGVSDGVLRYTADRGERNEAGVRQNADGDFEVYENALYFRPAAKVRVGPGCRTGGEFGFVCAGDGVTAVSVSLGDRDDRLCIIAPIAAPVRYSGGSGSRDSAVTTSSSCATRRTRIAPTHATTSGAGPASTAPSSTASTAWRATASASSGAS